MVYATGQSLVLLQKLKDVQAVPSNHALPVEAGLSRCHAPLFRSRQRIIKTDFVLQIQYLVPLPRTEHP
jgi:hypothetical protein